MYFKVEMSETTKDKEGNDTVEVKKFYLNSDKISFIEPITENRASIFFEQTKLHEVKIISHFSVNSLMLDIKNEAIL